MMFLFFFSKSCISQSKPLVPFYFYFFTMRSSAKTSILTPRSVKEVNNVLNGDAFSALHGAVVGLDYHLQNVTLLSAPDATYFEKSWGVTVADDDSIPTSMKTTMMSACLCVPAIRDIATAHRDERFFQRFFINRMCVDDAARQERLLSQAQHGWHTDGDPKHPFLTVVYTLYNGQSDSESLTAFQVGGIVGLSNTDDGRFRRASQSQPDVPSNSTTTSYFPKTNSFYIFPGYFVAHSVYKVKPGTVRHSIVMFVHLKRSIGGLKVDKILRREWALSGHPSKLFCCGICWSTFSDELGLAKHRRRSPKKCRQKDLLPF
jgi:hypothetical protein